MGAVPPTTATSTPQKTFSRSGTGVLQRESPTTAAKLLSGGRVSIFDSGLANVMIAASPRNLRLLAQYPGRFDVNRESVITGILTDAFGFEYVEESGCMPILEDMLREGFWPGNHEHLVVQSMMSLVSWGDRPTGPLEALARRSSVILGVSKARNQVIPLFTALFNTYSKNLVMSELAGSLEGLDFLFEIYAEEEIRGHARHDRRLRGALLERDLGGYVVVAEPARMFDGGAMGGNDRITHNFAERCAYQ